MEADRACFAGAAKVPSDILNVAGLPAVDNAPDYAGLIVGSGVVRAVGGMPNVVHLNPTDLTTWN